MIMKRKPVKETFRCEEEDNHQQHLCVLSARLQMGKVAKLAKGARFICQLCGRAAAKEEHLCVPMKI